MTAATKEAARSGLLGLVYSRPRMKLKEGAPYVLVLLDAHTEPNPRPNSSWLGVPKCLTWRVGQKKALGRGRWASWDASNGFLLVVDDPDAHSSAAHLRRHEARPFSSA